MLTSLDLNRLQECIDLALEAKPTPTAVLELNLIRDKLTYLLGVVLCKLSGDGQDEVLHKL
jgi:hypothetical protein